MKLSIFPLRKTVYEDVAIKCWINESVKFTMIAEKLALSKRKVKIDFAIVSDIDDDLISVHQLEAWRKERIYVTFEASILGGEIMYMKFLARVKDFWYTNAVDESVQQVNLTLRTKKSKWKP